MVYRPPLATVSRQKQRMKTDGVFPRRFVIYAGATMMIQLSANSVIGDLELDARKQRRPICVCTIGSLYVLYDYIHSVQWTWRTLFKVLYTLSTL